MEVYEHKPGDVCVYEYDGKNESLAVVEIVKILDDERGVAEIKFLAVIKDDTGNNFFDYLLKTGGTMNASLQYLSKIKHRLPHTEKQENAEREEPCDGCKFDVARKLLSKVVDDRFTEEMREFLLLVLENPELPVVPMVYTDCVGGDEYSYWLSKVGRSEIREFAIDEWYHDGKVVYRDDANAEEDLVEAIAETKYNGSLMDYEKAEAEAAGLWTKAIIVYITTP